MKNFRYLKNVATLELDGEKCIGCKVCTDVCPHAVLKMNEKKVDIVDRDGCMECGACAKNCPTGALGVTPGVGCASYIIQTWIKKDKGSCSCGDIECC
jgi:ferredoxin